MSMLKGLTMGAVAGLLALSPVPSSAASRPAQPNAVASEAAASNDTDFSARRRYYRRGPSAAGLAFMGAATGLIAGAVAESRRRDYYENNYYYGPRGYYGRPAYYGGGGYYGYGPGYYDPY